jgi:ferredoxin
MAKWATVDQETCTGCNLCVELCPEVFFMQADDKAAARPHTDCAEHNLEDVAGDCPVEAISVESDG